MSVTYDGGLGTTVNVHPAGTDVTVGFDTTLAIIGEIDGEYEGDDEYILVDSLSHAEEEFGEESELTNNYNAARVNGAGDIYAHPVDPDATEGTTYSEAAENIMSGLAPRYMMVASEDDDDVLDVLGVATDYANDLSFTRVFAPAEDVDVTEIDTYEPRADEPRLVEVASATATVAGRNCYTAAAVAGHAARQPLGASITYDGLAIDELGVEYRTSQAQQFDRVTAVTYDGQIVEGVTTSDQGAFSDIFQMEIVDMCALGIDEIAQDFAGDRPNTDDEQEALKEDCEIFLEGQASQSPPLLHAPGDEDAYTVDVDYGSDTDEVILTAGIQPVDVMKHIQIDLNVGGIATFESMHAA